MDPVDIGQPIHTIRKQKYHNQDDFAVALKTSEGNIKRIETSVGLPNLDLHIQKLFLNLSESGCVALYYWSRIA